LHEVKLPAKATSKLLLEPPVPAVAPELTSAQDEAPRIPLA
jgi:hypothetical protein